MNTVPVQSAATCGGDRRRFDNGAVLSVQRSGLQIVEPRRHMMRGFPERTLATLVMTKRILLVEDDSDTLEVLKSVLNGSGYQFVAARDAVRALAALDLGRYDGLILAPGMTDMDGLALLRQARQKNPHLPVILIMGETLKGADLLAIRHEAQDFLMKPFGKAEARYVVDKWCGPPEVTSTTCPV